MVGVRFGGRRVDVDDGSENVFCALLLLGVDVVKEILMRVSGTRIILLLIKVALHRERVLWKMF